MSYKCTCLHTLYDNIWGAYIRTCQVHQYSVSMYVRMYVATYMYIQPLILTEHVLLTTYACMYIRTYKMHMHTWQ